MPTFTNNYKLRKQLRLSCPSANTEHHYTFRSCGSEDDFYLNWSVEKSRHLQGGHHPPFRRQGSSHFTNSIDRMSVSSGESSATAHSTYDHPKTVLKVTSSPLALKRNGSSVSAMSSGPPVSPLRRGMSERASSVISNGSDMRRMVTAAPCGCGDSGSDTSSVTVAGHENYDIPRNLGRQVSLVTSLMSDIFPLISN